MGGIARGGTFELRPNRGHCRPLFECHSKGTKKPLSIGRGCTRTPWENGLRVGQYGCHETEGERERFLLLDIPSFLYKNGLRLHTLLCSCSFSFQCFSQKMQLQFQRVGRSHTLWAASTPQLPQPWWLNQSFNFSNPKGKNYITAI